MFLPLWHLVGTVDENFNVSLKPLFLSASLIGAARPKCSLSLDMLDNCLLIIDVIRLIIDCGWLDCL